MSHMIAEVIRNSDLTSEPWPTALKTDNAHFNFTKFLSACTDSKA